MVKLKNSTEKARKSSPSRKTAGSKSKKARVARRGAASSVAKTPSAKTAKKASKSSGTKAKKKTVVKRSSKVAKSSQRTSAPTAPSAPAQAGPRRRPAKVNKAIKKPVKRVVFSSPLAAKAMAAASGASSSGGKAAKGSSRSPGTKKVRSGVVGDATDGTMSKLPKTRLKPQELEEFRDMLLGKRRELIGDMTNLQGDALGTGNSSDNGGGSSMPIHLAELGTDTWEQEFTLGLIEKERTVLREIDEALERIDNQTYGICVMTGKPISKTRLRAKPWAKYCIEYARQRELGLA